MTLIIAFSEFNWGIIQTITTVAMHHAQTDFFFIPLPTTDVFMQLNFPSYFLVHSSKNSRKIHALVILARTRFCVGHKRNDGFLPQTIKGDNSSVSINTQSYATAIQTISADNNFVLGDSCCRRINEIRVLYGKIIQCYTPYRGYFLVVPDENRSGKFSEIWRNQTFRLDELDDYSVISISRRFLICNECAVAHIIPYHSSQSSYRHTSVLINVLGFQSMRNAPPLIDQRIEIKIERLNLFHVLLSTQNNRLLFTVHRL